MILEGFSAKHINIFTSSLTRVLYKICIVGGLIDGTSGTLSPPDLDLNIEWHINDEDLLMLNLFDIHTLDEGASGQYQLQVT